MIPLTHANFFPYETYRKEQQDIIRLIELDAPLKKNILLVAPNGTGKTVIALSALLPVAIEQDLKIIYLCRTHTQTSRVIRELRRIALKHPNGVAGLALRGRTQSCLHSTLLEFNPTPKEAMNMCQHFKIGSSCEYFQNLEKNRNVEQSLFKRYFNKPVDAEQLIEYCREMHFCPYYLTMYLLKFQHVIACSFQWILNPQIRPYFLRYLGVDLNKCILVIDECHNVIDMATQEHSHSLTFPFLIDCLENIPKMSELIRRNSL